MGARLCPRLSKVTVRCFFPSPVTSQPPCLPSLLPKVTARKSPPFFKLVPSALILETHALGLQTPLSPSPPSTCTPLFHRHPTLSGPTPGQAICLTCTPPLSVPGKV